MKTQDIFKLTSTKINESISKTFGRKLNLESFDLDKLEDARNKLRTQISQVRGQSGFNENLDNDAFHEAQWMLDAINAEIAERDEHIIQTDVEEGRMSEVDLELRNIAASGDEEQLIDAMGGLMGGVVADTLEDMREELADKLAAKGMNDVINDEDKMIELLMDKLVAEYGDDDFDDEGGETDDDYAMKSAGFGSDEDYESVQNEAYINNAADAINILADIRKQSKMAERGQGDPVRPNQLVNDLYDVMQWIEANMKKSIDTESITTGEDMRKVTEGEIQQASAIVTAKTMVDRVGRWIEELSGMENDTLLQLGDSIRDEMGQEQAKAFIEAVAPAIQQALENLKATRETLATGVRTLTGEEQGAEMLGAEPAADAEMGPAAPDAMNAAEPEDDEFAAADPAAGGLGDAGREQRESIDRSSNLLRILAG